MSGSHHELAAEFPEFKDTIHNLKINNAHFRKLFEQYHELNLAIGRSEQRIDLLSENEEERLRKERLKLKDELYQILVKASS